MLSQAENRLSETRPIIEKAFSLCSSDILPAPNQSNVAIIYPPARNALLSGNRLLAIKRLENGNFKAHFAAFVVSYRQIDPLGQKGGSYRLEWKNVKCGGKAGALSLANDLGHFARRPPDEMTVQPPLLPGEGNRLYN